MELYGNKRSLSFLAFLNVPYRSITFTFVRLKTTKLDAGGSVGKGTEVDDSERTLQS